MIELDDDSDTIDLEAIQAALKEPSLSPKTKPAQFKPDYLDRSKNAAKYGEIFNRGSSKFLTHQTQKQQQI